MSTKLWFIMGTFFILIIGTILHFVYDWSQDNPIVGIFGTINESVWEHLKLLFWPSFFFSLYEYVKKGYLYPNYLKGKAISFYLGIGLIISLFYTYKGITGSHNLIVDILIFILSVVISQYVGCKVTLSDRGSRICNLISLLAIVVLVLVFVVFTFSPPDLPIFKEA